MQREDEDTEDAVRRLAGRLHRNAGIGSSGDALEHRHDAVAECRHFRTPVLTRPKGLGVLQPERVLSPLALSAECSKPQSADRREVSLVSCCQPEVVLQRGGGDQCVGHAEAELPSYPSRSLRDLAVYGQLAKGGEHLRQQVGR
jgi:hypothetical protein